MKKLWIFILSSFCFLFFFTSNVHAGTYSGKLGYDYLPTETTFYYLTHDDDVREVYIHLGTDPRIQLQPDESDVFVATIAGNHTGKEYYYEICYADTTCIDTLDPFSLSLNLTRDKNVVFDEETLLLEGWDTVATLSTSDSTRSIYAIDAEGFTKNIASDTVGTRVMDSVFEKLYLRATLTNSNIGYSYLENAGFNYLEIGNVYDTNNYLYPNVEFSSKAELADPVKELKELIYSYHNIKMNVVIRTSFMTPSDSLKEQLLAMDSDYIADGKLNLNNAEVRRYLTDVYTYWVKEYKVDGFYIEDANLYDQTYLSNLVSSLTTINSKLFVYSNSASNTAFHVSDALQNSLYGSLNNILSDGVINGVYGEEAINKVINAMTSGYASNLSEYTKANQVINNFGSLDNLDVYAKLMIVNGIGVREELIQNKVRTALYNLYSSIGTPRVIAGNEFLNATRIPTADIASTPAEKMLCNSSSTLCYAKGDLKSINWEYLVRNTSFSVAATNYRSRYQYQYPSITSYKNATKISVNNKYADKGLLYFEIEYSARSNDDPEKSIYIVNYSDQNVTVDKISSKDYGNSYALLGSLTVNENSTVINAHTLFTFTEIRNRRLPNWVYIIIVVGLLLIIFGIRTILVFLLKKNKGIDYRKTIKAEKKQRKENRKKGIKEPKENIFETYILSDPLIGDTIEKRKEKRKAKKKTNEEETPSEEVVQEEESQEETPSEDNQKQE